MMMMVGEVEVCVGSNQEPPSVGLHCESVLLSDCGGRRMRSNKNKSDRH